MQMRFARVVPLIVLTTIGVVAARVAHRSPASDAGAAARGFLQSLSPELRARAEFKFDDPGRTQWNYLPGKHPGVSFGDMNDAQRAAARDLLRSALSPRGVLKAEAIMALDGVLRDLEKGASGSVRDPLGYSITVYGSPEAGAAWGWKIEGHHLSLNFTVPGDLVAVTPSFMGASPAEVRSGPHAGARVLTLEEDLGRELMRSLDDAQKKEALIAGQVPGDVLSSPGRSLDEVSNVGVTYAALNAAQKQILERLLEEYAGNLRLELSELELARIRKSGMDTVRFAWIGSAEPGRPHYYRISGPTFVIEFDNTQNEANHIHTVWHDRQNDFGHDLLKEHYEHGH